jgi:membrane protease YdiL (CAAX protease family)
MSAPPAGGAELATDPGSAARPDPDGADAGPDARRSDGRRSDGRRPDTRRPDARRPDPRRQAAALLLGCALLIALVVAVMVRRLLAGDDPAGNPVAGSVFAALLAAAVLSARWFEPLPRWRWFGSGESATDLAQPPRAGLVRGRSLPPGLLGLAAAGVLCLGPLARHLTDPGGSLGAARFPAWAVVVTAVAVTEEAFLRGALWQAVSAWRGDVAALAATTVAFALLHVPFYGPGIIPLDLAVGLLLGGLRMVSGGIADSVTAHLLADLAGWWLR